MEKSITIVYEEFKNNLSGLITNSGLPACMIESILDSYLKDIKFIVMKQYEADAKKYEESNKEK